MIDLNQEDLIPINQVPRLLPRQPNNKRLHISTVYRWMTRGIDGVKLEFIKIGGRMMTSRQALQRFAEKQTDVHVSRAATIAPLSHEPSDPHQLRLYPQMSDSA